MVQQESAGTLSRLHNHFAVQPTDQVWLAAQNRQTHAWLHSPAHLPIRAWVEQALRQLNAALPEAATRPQVSASPDGQWRATATNQTNSDLQCWQLWQGAGEAAQPQERITDVYPTGLAWRPDGSGFYYDRYLAYPGAHALYFHLVGTAQRQDRCLFYHAEHPTWYYQPTVSPDGRWLAITVFNHSANNQLILLSLCDDPAVTEGPPIVIAPDFASRYDILHWLPNRLLLRIVEPDAPNGRLVVVDLHADSGERDRESSKSVDSINSIPRPLPRLQGRGLDANSLTCSTVPLQPHTLPLVDAIPFDCGWVTHAWNGGCSELHLYDEQGHRQTTVPTPGLGTVLWLATTGDPPRLHYGYTDPVRPPQPYRWQPGQTSVQADGELHSLPYTPNDFLTRQEWISSADGTQVPLFLTHHRAVTLLNCPTLLTAYGGLGHAYTPHFSADAMTWLLAGGCYVTACVRGGSELGAAWHQAAVGAHKQRTFDDLLAVARWLIKQGITIPAKLGLWGSSNGGLTASACLTQAPQLFGAAVIESALLDMFEYPQLGSGATWLTEYGSPTDPTMQPALAAYSPLHNLQSGQHYPATLITTHECDPRVGAEHSVRFAAALQSVQGGAAPIMLRVDPGSGHSDGGDPAAQLAAATDRLTFLAIHLGLQP